MTSTKAINDASFRASQLRSAARGALAVADSRLLKLLLRDVVRDAENLAARIDEIANAMPGEDTPAP